MDNLLTMETNSLNIINIDELWEKLGIYLKTNLSASGYQTFTSSTTPLSVQDNILKIEVPNMFSKNWVNTMINHFTVSYCCRKFIFNNKFCIF